jgi:hypothetical protein
MQRKNRPYKGSNVDGGEGGGSALPVVIAMVPKRKQSNIRWFSHWDLQLPL